MKLKPMFEIQRPIPTLLLLRLLPPVSMDDAQGVMVALRSAIEELGGSEKLAVCTDVRTAKALQPDVADTFLNLMVADNDSLRCNGILYQEGGSMGLQLSRLLYESGGSIRVATSELSVLRSFLGQFLETEELSQALTFLG